MRLGHYGYSFLCGGPRLPEPFWEGSRGQHGSDVVNGRAVTRRARSIKQRASGNAVQSNEKDLIDQMKPDTQVSRTNK